VLSVLYTVCVGLSSKTERIVCVCVCIGETGSMRYPIYNLDRLF
jgi:hypothetical protein